MNINLLSEIMHICGLSTHLVSLVPLKFAKDEQQGGSAYSQGVVTFVSNNKGVQSSLIKTCAPKSSLLLVRLKLLFPDHDC